MQRWGKDAEWREAAYRKLASTQIMQEEHCDLVEVQEAMDLLKSWKTRARVSGNECGASLEQESEAHEAAELRERAKVEEEDNGRRVESESREWEKQDCRGKGRGDGEEERRKRHSERAQICELKRIGNGW